MIGVVDMRMYVDGVRGCVGVWVCVGVHVGGVQCGVGACCCRFCGRRLRPAACAGRACRGYQPHRSKTEALVEPAPEVGGGYLMRGRRDIKMLISCISLGNTRVQAG